MVEGKTNEDFKIARSTEVAPNLMMDHDGHLRRVWNEKNIVDYVYRNSLRLLTMERHAETWDEKETSFINFIAKTSYVRSTSGCSISHNHSYE